MNREILFRGKRLDNSEWAYGVPVSDENIVRIAEIKSIDEITEFLVDPETVGQFTGLCDKNGTKIFEGDIISKDNGTPKKVKFANNEAVFIAEWEVSVTHHILYDFLRAYTIPNSNILGDFEVVGNVYDNPELLRRKNYGTIYKA